MISGNDVLPKSGVSRETVSKQEIILAALDELGPVTRAELMENTGIKWTTLYDNLEKLVLKQFVHSYPRKSKKGRPATVWALS